MPLLGALLVSGAFFVAHARAQGPTLTHLYPVAGQQGTTVSVEASGKATPWPPKVWVDSPGITFKAGPKAPTFDVEIAKDAAPGAHFVRFYNEKGASAPRVFIVSKEPELREVEPNDRFNAPQKFASLPATIGGRLDKNEDVDSYAVTLKKGQTLVAWLEAYVLASQFDGMLRIVDERGAELAFNQDDRTLDPFLAWTAPADGTYAVQVMGFVYPATASVQFTGGEGDVYRLHLCAGPFVHHTLPLYLPRANPKPAKLIGWNLPPGLPLEKAHVETPIPVSDCPEDLEREPHDPSQAVSVPGGITGHISKAGEEDRYTLNAVKGKTYELKVIAAALGSPLDGWLKIEGSGGKELARADDAPTSRDPQLTWTSPEDGPVTLTVGDTTHHGGEAYFYRLSVNEAVPRPEGTIATSAFTIAPGKTTELKVQTKRLFKFAGKLELAAKGLPEGVSAAAVPMPDKDGEVTLKLTATAEAQPANGPFQLVLRETDAAGGEVQVANVLAAGDTLFITPLKDVGKASAEWPAVQLAVTRGLMTAPGGVFESAKPLTGTALAIMLAKLDGTAPPQIAAQATFTGVEFAHAFEPILTAAHVKLDATRDQLVQPMSRLQAARFLDLFLEARAQAKLHRREETLTWPEPRPPTRPLTLADRNPQLVAQLRTLVQRKLIDSPDYWLQHAVEGDECDGARMGELLRKATLQLRPGTPDDQLFTVAQEEGLIGSADYWSKHAIPGAKCKGDFAAIILRNIAQKTAARK